MGRDTYDSHGGEPMPVPDLRDAPPPEQDPNPPEPVEAGEKDEAR